MKIALISMVIGIGMVCWFYPVKTNAHEWPRLYQKALP